MFLSCCSPRPRAVSADVSSPDGAQRNPGYVLHSNSPNGNALTLINSIRLDDAGLAQLDALGLVAHVVKIGSIHGRDDAFYKAHYGATFWAAPVRRYASGEIDWTGRIS